MFPFVYLFLHQCATVPAAALDGSSILAACGKKKKVVLMLIHRAAKSAHNHKGTFFHHSGSAAHRATKHECNCYICGWMFTRWWLQLEVFPFISSTVLFNRTISSILFTATQEISKSKFDSSRSFSPGVLAQFFFFFSMILVWHELMACWCECHAQNWYLA